jgi:hypothetical protein
MPVANIILSLTHHKKCNGGFLMKKVVVFLSAMMFIIVGPAFAAPITLENHISFGSAPSNTVSTGDGEGKLLGYGGSKVNLLEKGGDYLTWSHSFTFNPPADDSPITGSLTIKFKDDGDIWLEYGRAFINGTEVMRREIDTMNLVFTAQVINGQVIVRVDDTGQCLSDFYVTGADFKLTYNPAAPAPVPEPATMTLLGIGMIGAGFVARKKNRK